MYKINVRIIADFIVPMVDVFIWEKKTKEKKSGFYCRMAEAIPSTNLIILASFSIKHLLFFCGFIIGRLV